MENTGLRPEFCIIEEMPAQLSLTGIDGVKQPTDRLFFGIFPGEDEAGQIEALAYEQRAKHGLRGSPLLTSRFHVTLCHVGDYVGLPTHFIQQAEETAAKIRLTAFEVVFDRLMSFRGNNKKPFVLLGSEGNEALHDLRRTLFTALKTYGPGCLSGPTFSPHITLLYDEQMVTEQPVEPVRLQAREFVLVHSLLGREKHLHLARWPLHG